MLTCFEDAAGLLLSVSALGEHCDSQASDGSVADAPIESTSSTDAELQEGPAAAAHDQVPIEQDGESSELGERPEVAVPEELQSVVELLPLDLPEIREVERSVEHRSAPLVVPGPIVPSEASVSSLLSVLVNAMKRRDSFEIYSPSAGSPRGTVILDMGIMIEETPGMTERLTSAAHSTAELLVCVLDIFEIARDAIINEQSVSVASAICQMGRDYFVHQLYPGFVSFISEIDWERKAQVAYNTTEDISFVIEDAVLFCLSAGKSSANVALTRTGETLECMRDRGAQLLRDSASKAFESASQLSDQIRQALRRPAEPVYLSYSYGGFFVRVSLPILLGMLIGLLMSRSALH